MFDTHAIIKKVFKDFFLGTGIKPSLDEYNKALSEINKDHADGPSVNKAHNLWIQYHKDLANSLPVWKRPLFWMLDCPYSADDANNIFGFTAFCLDNDIHFDNTFLAKVDKRSDLNKSIKLIVSIREIRDCKNCKKSTTAQEEYYGKDD